MTNHPSRKRAPKYSIAWCDRNGEERQRKQYPSFSSYAQARAEVKKLNDARRIKWSPSGDVGSFVVIEL